MAGVMDGIRVLEVASWTYVPMAGGVLAEWGADVIKIEHPNGGDPQRGLVTSGLLAGGGTGFVNYAIELPNRGKRSVGLDLGTEEGRELLLEMAKTADVFLTNFLPDARAKLRIDVADIRAVNPDIIYARGSANGPKGPEAHRGGYDNATFWARGGSAHIVTPPGSDYPLMQPGGAYGDSMGGLTIAGGISAALFHRQRTGEAVEIDCALLSMGAFATGFSLAACSAFGIDEMPSMTRSSMTNPIVNTYRTSDNRYLSLVMLQADRYWPELVTKMGHPELVADPRFVDSAARAQNNAECTALLEQYFGEKSFEEWKTILFDVEGIWAPVQTPGEVLRDPQLVENNYIRDLVDADGRAFQLMANPIQFNGEPADTRRSPTHGEHTDEVLLELGLDYDRIIELKISGAVL